jgi:hypothetical protein
VVALLAAPNPEAEDRLDAKLADIAAQADAAVIYLVDRDGIAVAASNAGTEGSFVGNDYGFRTYFRRAMSEDAAQQYALGTVSGRPGLYLSRRIDSVLGPLGVVVVKVEFDALESRWRDSGLGVWCPTPTGSCSRPRSPRGASPPPGRSPTRRQPARGCRSATGLCSRCRWGRTAKWCGSTESRRSPPALR